MLLIFTYLQCFASVLAAVIQFVYPSLVTTLIAVACSQFDKIKVAILDIRQQHITAQHRQEDGKVHKIADCDLQARLNACIRHHQDIIE
jgi:fructose-1,6-bisphosphatase/sedoheptulose 1,7-bisphosphatase-like protein